MPNTRQDIVVRMSGGDNVTNTIRGERASATSGPADAAQRLAEKLFGPALVKVVHNGRDERHFDTYVAIADDDMWASCTPEGRVHFDWVIPPANTGLAHGPRRALIEVMRNACWVVDPEGDNDPRELPHLVVHDEGLSREVADAAIARFLFIHSRGNNRKGSRGVLFSTTVVRCQL